MMENHFGVEFEVVHLPKATKEKILKIRNEQIKMGNDNYTMTDVIVWAVNVAEHASKMESKRLAKNQESSNDTRRD